MNRAFSLATVGIAAVAAISLGIALPSATAETLPTRATSASSAGTTPNSGQTGTSSAASRLPATIVKWQAYQRPSINGLVQKSSISSVTAPGPKAGRPTGSVLRFTLQAGATYNSSGYVAPRAEVYGRMATRSTPANEWPDPVGSIRWYTVAVYIPKAFSTTQDTKWLVLSQWKGLDGGSPPLTLEVKRDNLRLGGTRTNSGQIANDGNLGRLTKGKWTTISVGMKLSTSASTGWVAVIRDGKSVIPRTRMATMDTVSGHADPIYLKQGIYQDSSWKVSHVIYLSKVTVSSTSPTTH